jgi:dihydrofolate reductase
MEFRTDSEQSAAVFRETVDSIGVVIAGRTAFGDGDEAFFELPTFVLTRRPPPDEHSPKVTFVSDGIVCALELATAVAGDKQVNMFGGAYTAQQNLAAALIDELRPTVVPILFGDGLRLFGPDTPHRVGEIISSVATPTVTHLHLRLAGHH